MRSALRGVLTDMRERGIAVRRFTGLRTTGQRRRREGIDHTTIHTVGKSRALAGRRVFQGFPISIESPAGSTRHWKDPLTGEEGDTRVRYDYGYIQRTEGADGEHVDCYVGPDEAATHVHIVRQVNLQSGAYDEDKVMLGFPDEAAARRAYLAHYDKPDFLGLVIAMPVEEFRRKVHATADVPGMVRVGVTVTQKSEDGSVHRLYHVAFSDRVGAIVRRGIRATRRGIWHNAFGGHVPTQVRGAVYAFTERHHAVLWAAKQAFDFGGRPTSVIEFDGARDAWTPDTNQLMRRSAVMSGHHVDASQIRGHWPVEQEHIRAAVQQDRKDWTQKSCLVLKAGGAATRGSYYSRVRGDKMFNTIVTGRRRSRASTALYQRTRRAHHRWQTAAEEAYVSLTNNQKAVLQRPRSVSTLLDRLGGSFGAGRTKAVNLCDVSVSGTNIFCEQNKGFARKDMPQLKDRPRPGSRADALPKDHNGEVDISDHFIKHLTDHGVAVSHELSEARHLKATQNELNGKVVGAIMHAIETKTMPAGSVFVSSDDYILDGHHRWAAKVGADFRRGDKVSEPLPIVRIGMPILKLMHAAHEFSSGWGMQSQSMETRKDWKPPVPSVAPATPTAPALKSAAMGTGPRRRFAKQTSRVYVPRRLVDASSALEDVMPWDRPNKALAGDSDRFDPKTALRIGVPTRVTPTPDEASGVDGKLHFGCCYDTAGRYVMNRPAHTALTLVHGTLKIGPVTMGHGWVEMTRPDGTEIVHDGVQSDFYDKKSYYEKTGAVSEHRYTPMEAMKMMYKSKNFGPWEHTAGITKGPVRFLDGTPSRNIRPARSRVRRTL
jgi:hypothetical protein